jgi:hypothetical protein
LMAYFSWIFHRDHPSWAISRGAWVARRTWNNLDQGVCDSGGDLLAPSEPAHFADGFAITTRVQLFFRGHPPDYELSCSLLLLNPPEESSDSLSIPMISTFIEPTTANSRSLAIAPVLLQRLPYFSHEYPAIWPMSFVQRH